MNESTAAVIGHGDPAAGAAGADLDDRALGEDGNDRGAGARAGAEADAGAVSAGDLRVVAGGETGARTTAAVAGIGAVIAGGRTAAEVHVHLEHVGSAAGANNGRPI